MIPGKTSLRMGATLTLLAVALVLPSASGAATKPVIVAGVSQWGALTRAVVGPDATVVSLLTDPNADPHDHEATTADARHVARAALVIENGAGYDTWLAKLVAARASAPAVINVASLVHVRTGSNPHLFYSLANARAFVARLVSVLARLHVTAGVAARASALDRRLAGLSSQVATIAGHCAATKVAATEDVTGYLLAEMHLRVVTPEALRLAVGNGVDPSVRDLALALIQIKARPALLIDNIQTQTPLTSQIVSQAVASKVPVVKVTETMRGTDYVAWMHGTIAAISADLARSGPGPTRCLP